MSAWSVSECVCVRERWCVIMCECVCNIDKPQKLCLSRQSYATSHQRLHEIFSQGFQENSHLRLIISLSVIRTP